jgi:hypothetical protein
LIAISCQFAKITAELEEETLVEEAEKESDVTESKVCILDILCGEYKEYIS